MNSSAVSIYSTADDSSQHPPPLSMLESSILNAYFRGILNWKSQ